MCGTGSVSYTHLDVYKRQAEVTHLEPFGCFVDIGCGISSLIPIDSISVSRISHLSDRFQVGQNIRAVIKALEGGRVFLTHKELLGTWEENARLFHRDETVTGIVRSVEHYGIFVELTPNLAGLAEPKEGVQVGQTASVYIKSLIPEKMKIKLTVVDSFFSELPAQPMQYLSLIHILLLSDEASMAAIARLGAPSLRTKAVRILLRINGMRCV